MHTVKKKPTREIIGASYRGPKELTAVYASNHLPVLFIGETGSGKDLFIEFYMGNSPREGHKDIINCAAVSSGLLESEVFGHLKGSFTGASKDKKGYLERCENGVLCLDEIGDAPPYFQEAILRVAEGHPFYKVGSENPTACTALIIAATNKPEKIKPELKYRFHLVPIPPLRKRDIPGLCEYFLPPPNGKYLSTEILEELCQQSYPGNVRELKSRCEDVSAERGDRIFGTRKPEVTFLHTDYDAGLPLDYGRYLKEFRIWNEYLAPIIEEFNLKFLYKYQPFSGINDGFFEPLLIDPVNEFDFWTVLEAARIGVSEIVDPNRASATKTRGTFARIMQQIIAKKQLPCLLAYIIDKEGQSRSPKAVNAHEYAPQLINLLSLPIHNAERQFAEIYFSYLEAAYSEWRAAANHSGLSEDAYKKRKRRLKTETVKPAEK